MKIEVLITTMHATGFEKFQEMNIQSDAIIANQGDSNSCKEEIINGHRVKLITTDTRGASVNRNIALKHATGHLVMFADDDMVFVDDYEKEILNEFHKKEEVDAIKFYCESTNKDRPSASKRPEELQKAKLGNIMAGGVHALVIKRKIVEDKKLLFPEDCGPGCDVCMGEDSVFLRELLKKKVKTYVSSVFLAEIKQEESTWFKGYTPKYFQNLGYMHGKLYGRMCYLTLLRRCYKFSRQEDVSYSAKEMLKHMYRGVKIYYE